MTLAAPPPDDAALQAEFLGVAREVATTLIEQTTTGHHAEVPRRIDSWAPLADVTYDVERFGAQYLYARQTDLPLPCIMRPGTEYVLPINAEDVLFPLGVPADPRTAERQLRRVEGQTENGFIELLPPDRAERAFTSRLIDFLRRRLSWAAESHAQQSPSGDPGRPPGLMFQVSTDSPGLRVHYHPAYWHEAKTVFGQPSTPVRGYVVPGRFVFGAMGPRQALRFDPAEYEIPPSTSAHLYL
jgi:hypothetical protein